MIDGSFKSCSQGNSKKNSLCQRFTMYMRNIGQMILPIVQKFRVLNAPKNPSLIEQNRVGFIKVHVFDVPERLCYYYERKAKRNTKFIY